LLSFFHPFFFNATATTEIYTLSLHDALPILTGFARRFVAAAVDSMLLLAASVVVTSLTALVLGAPLPRLREIGPDLLVAGKSGRSEEHTSELQSRGHLVCRLLLEKKKKARTT